MSLLATTDDAEQVATSWLEKRYGNKLGRVKFIEVMGDGGAWSVKARVMLAAGLISSKPHIVQVKIDAATTDILGYSETEIDGKKD